MYSEASIKHSVYRGIHSRLEDCISCFSERYTQLFSVIDLYRIAYEVL